MAKAKRQPAAGATAAPAPGSLDEAVALTPFMRAAEVRENSFDEEANTIEVVWAAGAKVRRYSWRDGAYYDEALVMTSGAVRLGRMNAGAPFLDSHNSYSLRSVIGSVVPGTAKISGGKGVATVKLSRAPEDAATVGKIKDGIIRNISIGYVAHRIEKTEPAKDGGVAEWRVLDWEPLEISAVPIPADPDAQVRGADGAHAPQDARTFPCIIETRNAPAAAETNEDTMEREDNNPAATERAAPAPAAAPAPVAAPAAPAVDAAAMQRAAADAAAAAVRAERERTATIRDLGDKLNAREFAAEHELRGTDVATFRTELIDYLATRGGPATVGQVGAPTHVGEVAPEKRAAAIENAILHRADASVTLTADGRDFRGLSLIELARDCLEARGIRTRGMSKLEVAQRALDMQTRGVGGMASTSDFSVILSNVANITLRAAYEAAPQTFRPLVRVTNVSDFKTVTRGQLGEAPSLEKVNEHGEFKRGSLKDAGESYRVETFGKIVGITRQVIVNDDLEALTRLPRAFGQQAAQLESDIVWAEILANRAMGDGTALFHADHKNLAAAGAGITVATVSAGRLAISQQTGLDGKTVLNLSPSYIIVPGALITNVEQFLSQIYAAKTVDAVPTSLKQLVPISDPRLDLGVARFGVAGSDKAWFMAAATSQIDLIELAYLEGNQGVYTETRQGFDVDGVEIKVRLDVGAKAIDHRGLYKNPGQ